MSSDKALSLSEADEYGIYGKLRWGNEDIHIYMLYFQSGQ